MGGCLEANNVPSLLNPWYWQYCKKVLAEFFATAIFIFCGVASCLNWTHESDPDQLIRVALSFGFGLVALAYIFGPISGCHANPIVTLASILTRRITITLGLWYTVAQCLGAILGAGILYSIQAEDYSGEYAHLFGLTKINPNLAVHQGFFIEITATTIFILAYLLLTDQGWSEYKTFTTIGIGFTLVGLEIAFINASGGSMNPARSLGPAFIVADFDQLWVYWLGPMIGSTFAVGLYGLFTYEFGKDQQIAGLSETNFDEENLELAPAGDNELIISTSQNGAPLFNSNAEKPTTPEGAFVKTNDMK